MHFHPNKVIAQLFRLSSSRYTLPSDFGEVTANLTESSNTSIPNADIPLVLARLLAASERQEEILTSLQAAQVNEKSRYARLGRPVGATFLMISVIFVFLGKILRLLCSLHLALYEHQCKQWL